MNYFKKIALTGFFILSFGQVQANLKSYRIIDKNVIKNIIKGSSLFITSFTSLLSSHELYSQLIKNTKINEEKSWSSSQLAATLIITSINSCYIFNDFYKQYKKKNR